jgi:hypothetical protein
MNKKNQSQQNLQKKETRMDGKKNQRNKRKKYENL